MGQARASLVDVPERVHAPLRDLRCGIDDGRRDGLVLSVRISAAGWTARLSEIRDHAGCVLPDAERILRPAEWRPLHGRARLRVRAVEDAERSRQTEAAMLPDGHFRRQPAAG